jgi:hypothetical protein
MNPFMLPDASRKIFTPVILGAASPAMAGRGGHAGVSALEEHCISAKAQAAVTNVSFLKRMLGDLFTARVLLTGN